MLMLDPLADNGGKTLTHMPLVGSPAIDAGTQGGLATDQIGVARSNPATIGAVEYVAPPVTPPPPPPETNTTTPPAVDNPQAYTDVASSTSVDATGVPGAISGTDSAGNNTVTIPYTDPITNITFTAVVTTDATTGITAVVVTYPDPTTGQKILVGSQEFPAGVTIVASIVDGQLRISITVQANTLVID